MNSTGLVSAVDSKFEQSKAVVESPLSCIAIVAVDVGGAVKESANSSLLPRAHAQRGSEVRGRGQAVVMLVSCPASFPS